MTEPRLPPIISKVGLSSLKPVSFFATSLSPQSSSFLIGEPVSTALFFGRYCKVSGKFVQILVANLVAILLASPGVISDSCIMTGTFESAAAITTGTLTKPPFEKTISGEYFFIILLASKRPLSTLKGSVKFFKSKYLLSLPEDMPSYGIFCAFIRPSSIPFLLPMYFISYPASFSAGKSAIFGVICPAVPPPVNIIFFIQFPFSYCNKCII